MLVVRERSNETVVEPVGTVSIVAPSVLSSEYAPLPIALIALTFTLMTESLDRPVMLIISLIETVQLVESRVVESVPAHSDVLLT